METPSTGQREDWRTHTYIYSRTFSIIERCKHTEHNENLLICVCRKIVDHVDYLTSPEQVADYVKKFR